MICTHTIPRPASCLIKNEDQTTSSSDDKTSEGATRSLERGPLHGAATHDSKGCNHRDPKMDRPRPGG